MDFKEKVIAFVDIIGFKDIVEKSEKGEGKSLSEILEILNIFNTPRNTVCADRALKNEELDFIVTQISDCAIISAELSDAGIVNLIDHCRSVASGLMLHGIMCRGFITIGSIYHTNSQVIGTGYQRAIDGEKNVIAFQSEDDKQRMEEDKKIKSTPLIEIDMEVLKHINDSESKCISNFLERASDNDGKYYVINPFFIFNSLLSSASSKQVEDVNNLISNIKLRILAISPNENPNASQKSKYYYRFLDKQLLGCERILNCIENGKQPFPTRKMNSK